MTDTFGTRSDFRLSDNFNFCSSDSVAMYCEHDRNIVTHLVSIAVPVLCPGCEPLMIPRSSSIFQLSCPGCYRRIGDNLHITALVTVFTSPHLRQSSYHHIGDNLQSAPRHPRRATAAGYISGPIIRISNIAKRGGVSQQWCIKL
ncbi:hypothetical protein EVAR_12502_1 [Eumeta japonica]|uniref:Uncharacterized protein n=1 Tax=Eumeta variegata TaxID=151549 RepID=A0A4C1TPK7_EUMVA|nr:hypothetical protein EVAR_12502_1 [Eumeta japonica]